MPYLINTLPANDLGFLRIVAQLWGLELESTEPAAAAVELVETLCDAGLLEEVVSTLSDDGRDALGALFASGGRMSWPAFSRRFGEVRDMGPGKRDREKPHLRPASPAEILYYRALMARAFFDTPSGPQEFAYMPQDLFEALGFIGFEGAPAPDLPAGETPQPEPQPAAEPIDETEDGQEAHYTEPEYEDIRDFEEEPQETDAEIDFTEEVPAPIPPRPTPPKITPRPVTPPPAPEPEGSPGRAATPNERAHIIIASDGILDDATTLLAALRAGIPAPQTGIPTGFVRTVLSAAGIMGENAPRPEPVKAFLEALRPAALEQLAQAWQSSDINDLRHVPGLVCEGAWKNDPLVTREFLLDLLGGIPEGTWWSLPSLLRDIKARYPDFQRPAGNFDTWLIRRETDGESLRGFAHWDEVDGALIRYIVTGPLHWLGEVDLAAASEGGPATAFRLSNLPGKKEEKGKITVTSNGTITVPRDAPRAVRYQVARFCAWEPEKTGDYRYRITPAALKRAREQGLKVEHLLSLLARNAAGAVPPVFIKALNRWETKGTEVNIETLIVIKVASPETLNELRQKAGRFLDEVIGPTAVTVKSGAVPKVLAILNEMGFLAEEQE